MLAPLLGATARRDFAVLMMLGWLGMLSGPATHAAARQLLRADPPRVLLAEPDQGEEAVDPTRTQIRVRFDAPMSKGGRSICGGGPSFPTISGEIRWEDDRTIVIPVTLEPDRLYSLGINCPAARNFRGIDGQPAVPFPLVFKTRPAGAPAPEPVLTPAGNLAVLARARQGVEERYAYRDLRGVDWSARFADAARDAESAPSRAALARVIARVMGPARDPHVVIRFGVAAVGTDLPDVSPNVSTERLPTLVPGWKSEGPVAWGRFDDGIGYIMIASWPGGSGGDAALKPAHDALTELSACASLVVDVRANGGGDELQARRFAARFVDARAVYSRNEYRDPAAAGGFGPRLDRVIEPAPQAERFKGRVALLIGPACMSSNESFIAMMKTSQRVTTLGATTRGSSGNPKPHDLGEGITLVLPSWRDYLPDGTLLEGKGIAPDREVEASRNALAKRDPVLDAALEWLRTP